jgi:hypothetical protein
LNVNEHVRIDAFDPEVRVSGRLGDQPTALLQEIVDHTIPPRKHIGPRWQGNVLS